MSAMDQAVHDLQAHVQANPTQHPQDVNFEEVAAQKVGQMGLDPAFARFAAYLTTLQMKSDYESKLSRDKLHDAVLSTSTVVTANTNEIAHLKQTVNDAQVCYQQVQVNQEDIYKNLAEIKAIAKRSYMIAAENKQHSSKGNFILSGEGIPRPSPNEDLFDIVFTPIFEKYDIWVYPQELKAIHRLPNNKIFFSLLTRLPGYSFDKLIHAMNGNPKAHIKVYVSIQLFEPFKELHYIARRLKYHKVIQNYRLDENGHTNISLRLNTKSFRFTGLDQIESLGFQIPPQLVVEINEQKAQIDRAEYQSSQMFMEKAFEERPNYRPPPGRGTAPTNQPSHHRVYPPGPARAQSTPDTAQASQQPAPRPAGPAQSPVQRPQAPGAHGPRMNFHWPQSPPPSFAPQYPLPPRYQAENSPAAMLTTPPLVGVSPGETGYGQPLKKPRLHQSQQQSHAWPPQAGSQFYQQSDPKSHSFNGNLYFPY